MYFQISKLHNDLCNQFYNRFRVSFIAQWLIIAILWCQDAYIDTINKLAQWWVAFQVFTIKFIMSHPRYQNPKTYIMRSFLHGVDYTLAVQHFYATDKLCTVASLYRWLSKFYSSPEYIDIIFVRDDVVWIAQINLNDDIEVFTDSHLIDGNISLVDLPAKRLFECQWYRNTKILTEMKKQLEADLAIPGHVKIIKRKYKKFDPETLETSQCENSVD